MYASVDETHDDGTETLVEFHFWIHIAHLSYQFHGLVQRQGRNNKKQQRTEHEAAWQTAGGQMVTLALASPLPVWVHHSHNGHDTVQLSMQQLTDVSRRGQREKTSLAAF